MLQKALQVFLMLTLAWSTLATSGPTTPNYVETGECQDEQVCSYSYSARQEHFDRGDVQTTEINSTVEVTCTSSGVYNGSEAKLYCMVLKNTRLMSNMLENSTDDDIRAIQQSINELLQGWFCFVQTTNGKIPAIYHPPSEPDDAVSLKKAVAAAFQANFEGTDEEEEIDPQSRHTSHYTYTPTDEKGLLKMKRTVRRDDVTEFSSDVAKEDIDTSKDEEVEYRAGKLQRSSGSTTFHLANDSNSSSGSDTDPLSLSQLFSASGSYSLQLQTCRGVNRFTFRALKKQILSDINLNSKEEDLKATIDRRRASMQEMKTLREKLPSGSAYEALQIYESYGEELIEVLQTLMELESEYGALASHNPVIDEIITFMETMPTSIKARETVIILLSTEGSLKSQMALLGTYQNALNNAEANSILTYVSFMETVSLDFVVGFEELFDLPSDDAMLSNQLLLVFGSLAAKGSEQVEIRVIDYLRARVIAQFQSSEVEEDLSQTLLLLHALGNTGSKLAVPLFWGILNDTSSDNYNDIKLTVIEALVKLTDDHAVLAQFEVFLEEDPSEECVGAIVETLYDGFGYIQKRDGDVEQHISMMNAHPLVYSLAEVVSTINNTDLHSIMEQYLTKIKADTAMFALVFEGAGSVGNRVKRGTDWDASSNSDYNLVDSLVNRRRDASTYPLHRAYINAKTIGIDLANIKIGYGYFAGTSTHCDQMKTYGRFIVVGKLLSHTSTFADVKFNLMATTTSFSAMAYARIKSNTLLDYSRNGNLQSHCLTYSRNLPQFRARLLTLRFDLYVYVTTLTLRLDLHVHFDLGFNGNVCVGRTGTEVSGALGALTPTVGVTVSGGVSRNLLSVARGGITVSVTLNYRLEPAVSVQGCTAYCSLSGRICVGLYDSFPNNNVRLETWYQIRTTGFCGSGRFQYPCITWGSRQTWDALSRTWNIGSQARRKVWQKCLGNLHPTCAAGALSSPLFTQEPGLPLPSSSPATLRPVTTRPVNVRPVTTRPPIQQNPTWPSGSYSFPKTTSSCPSGFSYGCVFQDNEDSSNANRFSNTHLIHGQFDRNIRICYCTRRSSISSTVSWPPGQYCIARKGGSCPGGFQGGDLFWDDEDSGNINAVTGTVPDGVYNRNTRIYYCCRNDGSRNTAMRLPTSRPFILYQSRSRGCQSVAGMSYREISIRFDDEDNRNANSCSGSHPYDTGCPGHNHNIYLCYYN